MPGNASRAGPQTRDRPATESPFRHHATKAQSQMVAPRPRRTPGPGQTATDGVATVTGSALAPDNSRRLWAISYLCTCGYPHLGRARTYGDLGGWRRARCGRVVFVQIRRVYPPEVAR